MKKMIMLLLLVPGILAADKLYKWLDSKGVIHYSSSPPGQVRPGDVPVDSGDIISYEPKVVPGKVMVGAVVQRESGSSLTGVYCQKIRKNLLTLYKNERVRLRLPDGSYQELGESEKQAKIVEVGGLLKKHCH